VPDVALAFPFDVVAPRDVGLLELNRGFERRFTQPLEGDALHDDLDFVGAVREKRLDGAALVIGRDRRIRHPNEMTDSRAAPAPVRTKTIR
jgi:hypothetical protein